MPVRNNAHLTFNSVDVSADIMSLDVSEQMLTNDATVMSSITRHMEGGLTDWSLSGVLQITTNCRGASELAFLDIFRTAAKTASIAYRNDAGAKSADNAEWTGTAVLNQLNLSGATGAKMSLAFTLVPGGTLTRAVA